MSAANEKVRGGTYDVVAITACPTGIAHTFMAAKGLEDQAAKMGVSIKVETQGSGGAKNVLTVADIAGAKGVIIAADKKCRARSLRWQAGLLLCGDAWH